MEMDKAKPYNGSIVDLKARAIKPNSYESIGNAR